RAVVFLLSQKETVPTEVVKYLNRLSDLFFVMARWANKKENIQETLWAKQNKGTGR
ncbi:MAG: ATP:cob(I)alamin adenosyltransferase, partial [Deltaproteobacteria bacterium]|nr:ATP:cob(I)alamin adenosyltransferase [Deltaproteobacteria bacterium]